MLSAATRLDAWCASKARAEGIRSSRSVQSAFRFGRIGLQAATSYWPAAGVGAEERSDISFVTTADELCLCRWTVRYEAGGDCDRNQETSCRHCPADCTGKARGPPDEPGSETRTYEKRPGFSGSHVASRLRSNRRRSSFPRPKTLGKSQNASQLQVCLGQVTPGAAWGLRDRPRKSDARPFGTRDYLHNDLSDSESCHRHS